MYTAFFVYAAADARVVCNKDFHDTQSAQQSVDGTSMAAHVKMKKAVMNEASSGSKFLHARGLCSPF